MTFIKELTTPEDYVVFKLDIDAPAIEIALVQQIMGDRELLALIDEFYFEHHVTGSPMQWKGWVIFRPIKHNLATYRTAMNYSHF